MSRMFTAVAAFLLIGTFLGVLAIRGVAADKTQPPAEAKGKKIEVAIVTGGHPFDEKEFFRLFEGYEDVHAVHQPQKVGGEIFDNIDRWPYDVIVLYNFNQTITPKQQENFLKLLDRGVGLVILHHANAAYNNWPLFWKIAGVEYHFGPWERNGVKMPQSGFKGGVHFRVHVADPKHPITHKLADYDIVDETYNNTSVDPGVHALLTTDEPSSDRTIGWTKNYGNAQVCYLQSGHDATAYRNPVYRTLVVRALRWTASRLP